MDLIVLPEYSDIPAYQSCKKDFDGSIALYNENILARAKATAIRCNVFYADEVEEAIRYLEMGIDTILTNDYLNIANGVKAWMEKK